jgi:hypothetical protein
MVVTEAGMVMKAATEPATMDAPSKSAVNRASVRPTGESWGGEREREHYDECNAHCLSKHGAPPDIEVQAV